MKKRSSVDKECDRLWRAWQRAAGAKAVAVKREKQAMSMWEKAVERRALVLKLKESKLRSTNS